MMDDQHNEIINILREVSYTDISIEDNKISCQIIVEGHTIKLRCVLPPTFPFVLPTVYISQECYQGIAPLPHVNSDYSICTFDKDKVLPNFNCPNQVILASFLEATKVIKQGILKENFEDFEEEFNAYWEMECKGKAESIFSPSETLKILKCYNHKGKLYLAETKNDLDQFLTNVGISIRTNNNYHKCLYLPLNIKMYPPFPNTNLDFYNLVKKDKINFKHYCNFLKYALPDIAIIAFSLVYKGKRYMQLLIHTRISYLKGFRKHHIPAGLAFLNDTRKTPPIKYFVDNVSQERLFMRGGNGRFPFLSSVVVVGCGSVGSYIVEALSEYGIERFILVDNENLCHENIARHYCGYHDIGQPKVSAIRSALVNHNPNIKCELYKIDGNEFIENNSDKINSCDITFMVTANAPLEYHIIQLLNEGKINKPIIIIWVEPFLIAGHALIINKPQDVFSHFFDENLQFKNSVLVNATKFSKKESGCQSTYIPYSAFELKQFIFKFLDYLLNDNIAKHKTGNYQFTWCGKMTAANKQGCTITDNWKDKPDYSIYIERFD